MRLGQIALVVVSLVAAIVDAPHALAKKDLEVAGVRVPARGPSQPDGRFISSLGFKKTVVYFERYLRARALPHDQLPSRGVRGVLLSRFLSQSETSRWSAIHVFQVQGVTYIFVVPRQPDQASSEKPSSP